MATSPLPRWAPTPSPSGPLWHPSPAATAAGSRATMSPFRAVLAAIRRRCATLTSGEPPSPPPSPPAGAVEAEGRTAGAGGQHGHGGHYYSAGFDGIAAVVDHGDDEEERRRRDGGVYITWEDVWVTAVDGARGKQAATILHGVSGSARPGELLAIMGPSGCGKTTLLDALAGRLDRNLRSKGDILINGRRQKLAFGTSAYVTQENVLMASLTVREAIYFSALIQLPDSMAAAEKLARADETAQEMGLTGALDTRIGGRSTKGISGGQRKRLGICLETLTRPRLLFLDEPTSGLDSAASFHVMGRIAGLAAREGMAVAAVVHQPCGEVFELFHGLCLLAAGRTIYFGPAAKAAEFFTSNGYPCPPMRNPSDHFLRTINRDFESESGQRAFSKPSAADEAIETLVSAYKSSNISENTKKEMLHANEMGGVRVMIRRNQASFLTKVNVLTRRSFVNMYRDVGYYWLRLGIYIAISLCLGTIFNNFGYAYDSIRSRSSMLMFTGSLLTLMAIGGFPSFVEDMKIFRRERLNGHYGVSAFVISHSLSATPYLILIAVLPGAIAYYISGLRRGVDHFVYFALVLCSSTMLVEGLMMIIAAVVPDYLMGIITGAGVQGIMMLNCGFFQIPSRLPKIVWKYPMSYISFHKYALQGFYKNEFLGMELKSNQGDKTISGEQVITNLFEVEMGHSKWVDLAVLCGMVVIYRLLFVAIIKVLDMIKPMFKGARFSCRAH